MDKIKDLIICCENNPPSLTFPSMGREFIIICCLLLFTTPIFAGTTSLTTYYPPPTAAYNKINLATNSVLPFTTAAAYCTGSNINALYSDITLGTLYKCTGSGASSAISCSSAPDGTLFLEKGHRLRICSSGAQPVYCASGTHEGKVLADTTGTLHVCMNSSDVIYPQQCVNLFCSYLNVGDCSSFTVASNTICPAGYNRIAIDASNTMYYDTFTIGNNTNYSAVCCSGVNQITSSP